MLWRSLNLTGALLLAVLPASMSAQGRPDPAVFVAAQQEAMSGDFVVTPTEEGFTWEIPAGPMTIRYEATVQDGTWTETGDRIAPGQDPIRFFEMTLTRQGDTDWPAAGAVAPE